MVKARHAATTFSGKGAGKTGGRWNSHGVPMVYASATRSLAALETLVHLNPPLTFSYSIIRLEFDASLVESLKRTALPPDWRSEPPPVSTRGLGDHWTRAMRSAVLAVSSVIIPDETTYLLNPAHPDSNRIVLGRPVVFAFDPRLLG